MPRAWSAPPLLLVTASVLLAVTSCAGGGAAETAETPIQQQPSQQAGGTFADSFARHVVTNEQASIYADMESSFRATTGRAAIEESLARMQAAYGRPLESVPITSVAGRKAYSNGQTKEMRTYWYGIRTSRHDWGSHFLFVEVVHDLGQPACSGFAVVTFPLGAPGFLR